MGVCAIIILMLGAGNQLPLLEVPPTPARSLSDLPSAKQDGRDVALTPQARWASKNPDKVKGYRIRWNAECKRRFATDPEYREKRRLYRISYLAKSRDKVNKSARKRARKIRKEFLIAYGGKCICCNESQDVFLTLEHKLKDGAHDRRHQSTDSILGRLKRLGWPKDNYTILCWNCNAAIRFGDKCPHQS